MNPLVEYRAWNHLTQRQLANKFHLAEVTVRAAEQGTLTRLPITLNFLQPSYHLWQSAERQAVKDRGLFNYGSGVSELWHNSDDHPLTQLRFNVLGYGSSVNAFAKLIKVRPRVISDYEAGRVNKLPTSLHSALLEVGYSHIGLDLLEDAVKLWRQNA